VAVKVLPPYIAEKEGFTERFTREAQAIGNLHHPNILPVYDTGQDRDYGYIAMRYIPNARTLSNLMKQPLDNELIIRLTAQIADALDYAHRSGIVHRDVKPSNILLDGDWVLLSDFGLAKMVEVPSEITGTGVGIGTPAYMSPEQAKGEKVDHRTDNFALGIILFEMLTGQVPHKAETPLATVMKRISEPLPSPRSLNPDLPEGVEVVLMKALATDPNNRFDHATEMIKALEDAFAGKAVPLPAAGEQRTIFSTPPESVQIELSSPPISEPVDSAPQPQRRTRGAVDIVAMTLFGVVGVCGVSGVLLSFIPDSETGQITMSSLSMAPTCAGMTFASLTSIAMLWFRNKSKPASAWLALGIVLWFVGVNIFSFGIFGTLTPDEDPIMTDLGFSLVLCFAPGGFMALLGLILYGYDHRLGRRAASQVDSRTDISTGQLRTRADKLQRAGEYHAHIADLLQQYHSSPLSGQLAPMEARLGQWENHLRQLIDRLNEFESNKILQRDMREVPVAISKLEDEIERESDPRVRAQMQETLDGYREHQRQLNSLKTTMRRTELEIDETLAEIGAIYSRLQLLDAREIDSNRVARLSEDMEEQADRLNDLLSAMDEVYDSSAGIS
jgi:serine/threonine protein kinase